MQIVRTPFDKMKIPAVMYRLDEYIKQNTDKNMYFDRLVRETTDGLLYELIDFFDKEKYSEKYSENEYMGELYYSNVPFEIVPFSWNGGDGLSYSWVNLTPELDLDDYPCVSWAPVDDGGAVWLGDNTAQAMSNLMLGNPGNPESEEWQNLVSIIGVEPDQDLDISTGARSDLQISPEEPQGWRFEMAPDGIGVLAKEDFFSETYVLPDYFDDLDQEILIAEKFLKEQKPATSLLILKYLREDYLADDESLKVVTLMEKAYLQLGRPTHARRTQVWRTLQAK